MHNYLFIVESSFVRSFVRSNELCSFVRSFIRLFLFVFVIFSVSAQSMEDVKNIIIGTLAFLVICFLVALIMIVVSVW